MKMLRTKRSVDFEQYFTDADLAEKCLAAVCARYDLESFSLVLEPSVGDGVFFKLLPEKNRVGIDIMPLCKGVDAMDFFRWGPPLSEDNILTIGNPPFGQRGSQAIAFMNRVNPNFHLEEQFDCNEFRSPEGVRREVKSVFQIWERRQVQRVEIQRSREHGDFDLKHAHLSRLVADYDFAIAQVGSNFVPKELQTLTAGSYWYVRATKPGCGRFSSGWIFHSSTA